MVYTPKFEKGLSLLEQLLANRERDELSGINREKMREMAMANQMNQEMLPYAGSMAKAKNKMSLADALRTERLAEHQGLVNQYYVPNIQSEIGARNASAAMARMNTALAPSKHSLAQSRHALDQQKFSPEQLAALSRFRNATSEQREYQNSPQFRAATLKAMERRGMSNFGKLKADEAAQADELNKLQMLMGGMQMGQREGMGMPQRPPQQMPQNKESSDFGERGFPFAPQQPQEMSQRQPEMPMESQGLAPEELMRQPQAPAQKEMSNQQKLAATENSEMPDNLKELLPPGYSSDKLLQGAQIRDDGTYSAKDLKKQENDQLKRAQVDLDQYKLAVYKASSDPQQRRRALAAALLDYTYKQVPLDALLYYTGPQGRLRLVRDRALSLRGKFTPEFAKYRIYKGKIREWGAENLRAFGGSSVHFRNTERLKNIMGDIAIDKTPEELLMDIEGGRKMFENEAQIERSSLNKPDFYSIEGYTVPGTEASPFNQILDERESVIGNYMKQGLNRKQAEKAYQDKLRNVK